MRDETTEKELRERCVKIQGDPEVRAHFCGWCRGNVDRQKAAHQKDED